MNFTKVYQKAFDEIVLPSFAVREWECGAMLHRLRPFYPKLIRVLLLVCIWLFTLSKPGNCQGQEGFFLGIGPGQTSFSGFPTGSEAIVASPTVTVYPGKLQNAFSPVIFLGWGINRFFALEIVALTIETSATSNVFDEKANLQATTIGAKISVPLGARTLASLRFGSGTAHLVLKNSNADTGVTCFIFCSTADTDSKFDGRSSMSGLAFVRGIGDKNPASFFSSAHVEFGYLEHQITYDQMHTLRFTREVSFTSQLQTYYIAIVASTR